MIASRDFVLRQRLLEFINQGLSEVGVAKELQRLQLREIHQPLRIGQSAAFSSLSISSRLRVRSVEALGRKREVPSHVS